MAVLMRTYKASDLVGELAMDTNDGKKVYDVIHPELLAGHNVELDFEGVRIIAPAFWGRTVADLFLDIKPEEFHRLFKAINLSPNDIEGLELMVEDAIEYHTNPAVRAAVDAVMEKMSRGDYDR